VSYPQQKTNKNRPFRAVFIYCLPVNFRILFAIAEIGTLALLNNLPPPLAKASNPIAAADLAAGASAYSKALPTTKPPIPLVLAAILEGKPNKFKFLTFPCALFKA
jgi:hypothetical protein